jgi:hypothetical protein
MERVTKPFIHLTIDAVDTVIFDPEGRFDADLYDRYPTFAGARDAALSSIELMLDLGDYDGDDHRAELEAMLGLLEPARAFEDLERHPAYRSLLGRLEPAPTVAA